MSPRDEVPYRYRVRHLTRYDYDGEVVHSHQMLRLVPRVMPHQTTSMHQLTISPQPVVRVDAEDAFGNPVTRLQIDRPHDFLVVDAQMEVEVRTRPPRKANDSQPWRELRDSLRYSAQPLSPEELEVRRYLSESPHVRVKSRFSEFAADCFPPGGAVLECAENLMHKIHAEFTYAPGETQIMTPLLDVLGS
jgi:transglutaminase-like putative cysteine protease